MTAIIFSLILFSVGLNAGAQLLLKNGMNTIGSFNFNTQNLLPIAFKVASNPCIISGLFIYVMSVMVWLMVLSRTDVSLAYPMTSLGYIVTAIAGLILFQEPLSPTRIIGILIIMTGVYVITRS